MTHSLVMALTFAMQKKEHLGNVVLMLAQRLRRWSHIKTTLGRRLVFAESMA